MLHGMAQPCKKNITRFFLSFIPLHSLRHFYFFLCVRYASFVHPFHRHSHCLSLGAHIWRLFFPLREKKIFAICSAPCFKAWLSLVPFLHSLRFTHKNAVKKKIFFYFLYKRSLVLGGGGGGRRIFLGGVVCGWTTKRWFFWAVGAGVAELFLLIKYFFLLIFGWFCGLNKTVISKQSDCVPPTLIKTKWMFYYYISPFSVYFCSPLCILVLFFYCWISFFLVQMSFSDSATTNGFYAVCEHYKRLSAFWK